MIDQESLTLGRLVKGLCKDIRAISAPQPHEGGRHGQLTSPKHIDHQSNLTPLFILVVVHVQLCRRSVSQ